MSWFSLGILLFLSACDFKPLYGTENAGATQELHKIMIKSIPERLGQVMRQNLIHALTPAGQPRHGTYILEVTLKYSVSGGVYLTDDTASRMNVVLATDYKLLDKAKKILTKGKFSSQEGYNVVIGGDYATVIAEEKAKTHVAELSAQEIKLRLADYFTSR